MSSAICAVYGRKSEIRVYCLIASTDPLLVLVQEEAIRLACRPFELGEWADPLIHLENTSRAKKVDPDLFERLYPRLKRSLSELGTDVANRGLTDDPNWVDTTLRPSLTGVLREVLRAAEAGFERRPGSFQLIGMDCILSDDLSQLWLTEFQRAPGLAIKHPIKERLIPAMLTEILEIVMEIQDRRSVGADLSRLETPRGFEWVINDAAEPRRQPRFLSRLRSKVQPTQRG